MVAGKLVVFPYTASTRRRASGNGEDSPHDKPRDCRFARQRLIKIEADTRRAPKETERTRKTVEDAGWAKEFGSLGETPESLAGRQSSA